MITLYALAAGVIYAYLRITDTQEALSARDGAEHIAEEARQEL